MTITLPDDLAERLRRQATQQAQSAEAIAVALLRAGLETDDDVLELEHVISRIREAAPNPRAVRHARAGLDTVLGEANDSRFDVEAWQAAWSRVEAEMAAIEAADDDREPRSARS
jgi:plasmid stability protein